MRKPEWQMRLFKHLESTEAHGKSVAALRHSRDQRAKILRMFDGVLPTSIMRARRGRRKDEIARGSYDKAGRQPQASGAGHERRLEEAWRVSGHNVRQGALSQFPYNVGRALLRLYTTPGMTVVDPFAGHNSRMEFTVMEGRHYIGYDVSQQFMKYNRSIAGELQEETGMNITLYEANSEEMGYTVDETGDFTITSPPYWDLEFYGDESEQLGYKKSYPGFLDGLQRVAHQNFRVLRSGAFCVWIVNDFRKKGQFYSFHIDALKLLLSAGFVQHDIMIIDYGSPIRAAFATQLIDTLILPKQHEYALVMKKEKCTE